MKDRKSKTITIIASIAFFLISFVVALNTTYSEYSQEIQSAEKNLQSQKEQIEHFIEDKLLAIKTLENLVIDDNGDISNFQTTAKRIFGNDPSVRCIQLAPHGLITPETIYPYEGNEQGVGNLLSEQSPRYQEILKVLEAKDVIITVPKQLHQGGRGPIARKPIYLKNALNEEELWGFAILIMDFDFMFEKTHLNLLSSGKYDVQLSVDEDTSKDVLFGNGNISSSAIKEEVNLPGATWNLYLIPKKNWISTLSIIKNCVIVFSITFLGTLAIHYLHKAKLKTLFLERVSTQDDLTILENNRSFRSKINSYVENKIPFGLYILDINKFKNINDTFGHIVGDSVLKETAERVYKIPEKRLEAFRVGGDEFAVIFSNSTTQEKRKMKDDIISTCSIPFSTPSNVLDISVSCGLSSFPEDSTDVDQLIKIADANMYHHKLGNAQSYLLTGREHFLSSVRSLVQKNRTTHKLQTFYFFHMDFDGFKYINFRYGTEIGDSLIQKIVKHINSIESCEICGRGFADQIFFLMKFPSDKNKDEIEDFLMEQLNTILSKENINYRDVILSLWIGYSKISGFQVYDAVGRANLGRLKAKQQKIKKPVFIDEEYTIEYMNQQKIKQSVLKAFEDKRITYHVQPQIDMKTEKIVSMEVLGRMYKHNGEIISPSVFVPFLEDSGLIMEFDLIVFELACKDIVSRSKNNIKNVPLSFNLSKYHALNINSVSKIEDILRKYNLSPNMFCFEITETTENIDRDSLKQFCNKLRDLGFKISLDDFGVGESRIGILNDIKFDEIKLDRNFMVKLTNKKDKNYDIIESIISLAKKYNIKIVCEGVENTFQYQQIKNLNIDLIQGFIYSQPDTLEKISEKFIK